MKKLPQEENVLELNADNILKFLETNINEHTYAFNSTEIAKGLGAKVGPTNIFLIRMTKNGLLDRRILFNRYYYTIHREPEPPKKPSIWRRFWNWLMRR